MSVTACICHEVSFRRLLEIREQIDPERRMGELEALSSLRARTGCSSSCATCRPYILLALRTGRTELPVLTGEQASRIERDAAER